MVPKQIFPNTTKENKFSRTLNINKNLKYNSKSNYNMDINLTKPIKIKNLNKFKSNIIQQNKNNSQIKIDAKEKEIDASLEDYLYKETIQPIYSNKNIKKNNINIGKKYIKITNKTPNKIIKTIKNQLISNDINNVNNIRKYNHLINGGNVKNPHGKLNLNITLNNKSPIRLRKINMNKKYVYGADYPSSYKKEKQINTIFVNNNKNMNMDLNMNIYNNDLTSVNNTLSNEESTIITLQEEIENQKRENLYKEMLINDMKKQLDDINIEKEKDQIILSENFKSSLNNDIYLLKQEIDFLNNKITNDINNVLNNDNNNKEEAILFDKLKRNYTNNKNLINELIKENENLTKKINEKKFANNNQKNYYSYVKSEKQKNLLFNYLPNENSKQYDDYFNNSDEEYFINKYLEFMLKSTKNDFFQFDKNCLMDDKQKNNIKLMIKMTLNSNFIQEDEIISLFLNNLLDYKNAIDTFCNKYMKVNILADKEIIHNYFKLICFDSKKLFNINNLLTEIMSFYDENIKNLEQIKLNDLFSKKRNSLIQILKECKLLDNQFSGLIELNQFKNILNKNNFFKEFKEKENEIFNILIYNMKKYINIEQIGLFQLSYINLCNDFGLNDSLNFASENNSLIIEKTEERKDSLFKKQNEEKEGKQIIKNEENKIKKKIISNVDFKPDKNTQERGSGNSNNTFGLLSSKKFSFDYSSKSGSKEAGSLKDGVKEIASQYMENEEYLVNFCKGYVDNLFNIIMEEIKRKKIGLYNEHAINIDNSI